MSTRMAHSAFPLPDCWQRINHRHINNLCLYMQSLQSRAPKSNCTFVHYRFVCFFLYLFILHAPLLWSNTCRKERITRVQHGQHGLFPYDYMISTNTTYSICKMVELTAALLLFFIIYRKIYCSWIFKSFYWILWWVCFYSWASFLIIILQLLDCLFPALVVYNRIICDLLFVLRSCESALGSLGFCICANMIWYYRVLLPLF